MVFKKNQGVSGFPIGNFINATTGATVTTGTPTCKRLLDGTAGSLTNAAAYDSTFLGWKIDLAAGDLNADMVGLSFTLTDCLPISYAIRTTTKLTSDLNDIAAGALMGLANDAITSDKFDETTAFPLKSADAAATAVARVGADSDTLETLSDQVDLVQASLGTIAPTTDSSDSFTQAAGSVIAGTYANTQTDDGNYHTLAPDGGGLDATYVFECGVGRAPTAVSLNGYWNGAGKVCDIYAYDYDMGIWDKLSNSSTQLASRNSEANYSYGLNREHMDAVTNPGNVSIRFVSASTTAGNRLYVDRLLVNTVSDSTGGAGSGGGITAQMIWEYVTRTLTTTTGEPANSSEIADAVLDELLGDHTGLGSLSKAISDILADYARRSGDYSTYAGGDTSGTTELLTRIPDADPGTNGGLPTVDANNYVAGIQGTLNTLDDLNDFDASTDTVLLAATQGAITWDQQKITANAASEGALHITNTGASGIGIYADGTDIGIEASGGVIGQYNTADGINSSGQYNESLGVGGYGLRLMATNEVDPVWAKPGGDGDTLETLSDQIDTAQGTLTKLEAMIEADGPDYRFDANALEEAPSAGASLTAQQTRDAMKLAPTAGAPAAGSIDKHLDDIAADDVTILARLGSATITVTSPINSDGDITITRGDDYLNADGRGILWTDTGTTWPALDGTVNIEFGGYAKLLTIVSAAPPKQVRWEPTAAETDTMGSGTYAYAVYGTDAGGHLSTFVRGTITVLERP